MSPNDGKKSSLKRLNPLRQCKEYDVSLWQCPQFLFVVMGAIIVISIIAVNTVARKYLEPEVVALIVLGITAILFVVSHVIVSSFERIAESSRAKSEFVSIMSHRLRNPLSGIKWKLDLMLGKKISFDSENFTDLVEEIKSYNERMIMIVNDLLDLNHLQDKKLVLSPSTFSLKTVVDEAVELARKNAGSAHIMMSITAPQFVSDVYADRVRIKGIVFHLLDNAVRYMTRKGKVIITIEELPKHVRLLVADEGVGISEENAKKIFTKFFRIKNSLYYQTEGTGIGLYLAKHIIGMSGGRMGFSSIEGKGSTFWFTLPSRNM